MMHDDKATAPLPKVVRETEAEAVAFVVCRGIGLETNNAAADYIALYNGDQKTFAEPTPLDCRSDGYWTTCTAPPGVCFLRGPRKSNFTDSVDGVNG